MNFSIPILFSIYIFFSYATATESRDSTSKKFSNEWKFIGKENGNINGRAVTLNVMKNDHSIDVYDTDEEVVSFIKNDEDNTVVVDSLVYADGSSRVSETDFIQDIVKVKNRTGSIHYTIKPDTHFEEEYVIGEKKENLYNSNGTLKSKYREIRGDTAFINRKYMKNFFLEHKTDSGTVIKQYFN